MVSSQPPLTTERGVYSHWGWRGKWTFACLPFHLECFELDTVVWPDFARDFFCLFLMGTWHRGQRERKERKWSYSVVSDSFQPHGLQPTRVLHPWNFPGKNTGVGCYFLFQAESISWHLCTDTGREALVSVLTFCALSAARIWVYSVLDLRSVFEKGIRKALGGIFLAFGKWYALLSLSCQEVMMSEYWWCYFDHLDNVAPAWFSTVSD